MFECLTTYVLLSFFTNTGHALSDHFTNIFSFLERKFPYFIS